MTLAAPLLIAETRALEDLVARALSAPAVAIDTESDSFYHYREKICLVQLSFVDTSGQQVDAIVDPLAPGMSLQPMSALLEAKDVVKVFHDVGYDLVLFKRLLGVVPRPLSDTMLGLRMLGTKAFGLGPVLKERFGIELDKGMQRSDWSQRPLTAQQVEYAANDTRHLLALAKVVEEDLRAANRHRWFVEECERLLVKPPNEPKSEEDRFWQIKGIKKLKGDSLAVARAIFALREHYASEWDKPPFRVFSNETLLALATERPRDQKSLSRMKGMSSRVSHAFGPKLVAVCEEPPPYQPRVRPPRSAEEQRQAQLVEERFEKLRLRRKEIATSLGLDPEVLVSNATLLEFAKDKTATTESHPEFSGWRGAVFGDKLLT